MDVGRTACQVIAGSDTAYGLIHLWASIATVDYDRLLPTLIVISTKRSAWSARLCRLACPRNLSTPLEMTRWGDHIPLIIPLAKHLQPPAEALQIFNMYVRGDVPILRFRTCLAHLSERKVLAESCLLVNTYFCHNLKSKIHKCYGDTVIRRQRMTLPVFLNTALVVPFSTKSPAFSTK